MARMDAADETRMHAGASVADFEKVEFEEVEFDRDENRFLGCQQRKRKSKYIS